MKVPCMTQCTLSHQDHAKSKAGGKNQTMLFGPIGPPLATQQCCDVGVLMTCEWLDADSAMLPVQRCFSDATCTMMLQ